MRPEDLLAITRDTIKAAEFCFLITLTPANQVHARLMQPYPPENDLTIWFGVSPTSRKVQEIQINPQVTLAYSFAEQGAYVTLHGSASVETNLALRQKYWRESFAQFWPAGPTGEDYALVKVIPTRIELMNIARRVAPKPFGLRAVVLVRHNDTWVNE
jgi:general stress protein 26